MAEKQKAQIIFEPEYRRPEAFRGIEEYDYIWLIWQFSEAVEKAGPLQYVLPDWEEMCGKVFLPPDPLSSQSSGAVLCPAGKGGAASKAGNHTSCIGRRPYGRHSCF